MDFNDTPEQARFREEASSWLAENVPTDEAFRALPPLEQAKLWQKRKYDAGWACIGWAPEFGGRGASPIEEVIWRQEESKYELPATFFLIGQGMIAPTLMAWASDEDKARFLPPSPAARKFGASCFRSPQGAPIWRRFAPARNVMGTNGSLTARKSGRQARIFPITA